MNDRELLEKAARAAGLRPPGSPVPMYDEIVGLYLQYGDHDGGRYSWNPLTYDGDRYRLARACNLRIDFYLQRVLNKDGCVFDWTVNGNGDDEAHAIVRAAAAMDKGE